MAVPPSTPAKSSADAPRPTPGEPLVGSPRPASRLVHLTNLIRLRSQTGTWLLALPSLWSLSLASHGRPELELVCLFLAGAFIMRSAGVVLNDLADRHVDGRVTRTKFRPLAAGTLTVRDAWLAVLVLLGMALLLLSRLPP